MKLKQLMALGVTFALGYCGNSTVGDSALLQAGGSASAKLSAAAGSYLVGTGIYDITGPAAEIVMMGFAESSQKTAGIHTRLRARSFIAGDGVKRVVFVSCDLGMLFQSVKLKVADKIAADAELKDFYNERNILLSATHTHGGPGGYSGYFLYDATVNGFIKEHHAAIVDGVVASIRRAHRNLHPGKILVNEGRLEGVGGNRAVEAYENNPPHEKALYDGNTDKTFTILKFISDTGEELGAFSWFAVHPDSIGPGNHLITADNKGIAAWLFEKDKGTDYLAERTFVAGFAQANEGDVTPNIGFGLAPADLTFAKNKSLENAALKQYQKAKELYDAASESVTGSIDFRHEWVDMRTLNVAAVGKTTCAAAMGASFSAGSPYDNPSPSPLFPNGVTADSLSWSDNAGQAALSTFLGGIFAFAWPATQDAAYKACHAEKPILIPTGKAHLNINGPLMTPQTMPLQIIKLGSVALIAVPGETTTMAGRRFRKAVVSELASSGVRYGIIAGLSNSYASYLATREEYAKQWYEGASTQFGPHQQAAYQQEFVKLSRAIAQGSEIAPGPRPEDVTAQTTDFTAKVVFDDVPWFKKFGDVVAQPRTLYRRGELVSAQFWGGHPNNNYRTQDTFLVIEKWNGLAFVPIARDWDPQTTYQWARDGIAYSKITITYDTTSAEPGIYRIRHKGDWKSGWTGKISAYEGVTNVFSIE
ncbi:MAG: neutral/alkaline ceramidase [Turneriella sp.]